MATDE